MTTDKKLDELYALIEKMEIALMTTRSSNGRLVTRPMDTQKQEKDADLWFVTEIGSDKIDDIKHDPNVNLGYYDDGTKEWVSVSGTATVTQDRAKIHELYKPDWRAWFGDEGGEKDGGPDDPRLALIFVDTETVHYMKAKHSKPVTLFEIAKGVVTGTRPDLGRNEELSESELG